MSALPISTRRRPSCARSRERASGKCRCSTRTTPTARPAWKASPVRSRKSTWSPHPPARWSATAWTWPRRWTTSWQAGPRPSCRSVPTRPARPSYALHARGACRQFLQRVLCRHPGSAGRARGVGPGRGGQPGHALSLQPGHAAGGRIPGSRAHQAGPEPNYSGIEGYVAAKVFTDAVRKAGRNLTREGFISAIQGMRNLDLGGFPVDFGPNKHTGSQVRRADPAHRRRPHSTLRRPVCGRPGKGSVPEGPHLQRGCVACGDAAGCRFGSMVMVHHPWPETPCN
jgi:hypothetical protein